MERIFRLAKNLNEWLKRNGHVANWMQAFGVIAALIFGSIQIYDAKKAIEITAGSNLITLRSRLSDILIDINKVAIDNPDIDSGFTSAQRLQLIRIEYFFQVHNLYTQNVISEDRHEAEQNYLNWIMQRKSFRDTWLEVRMQYPTEFRNWLNDSMKRASAPES